MIKRASKQTHTVVNNILHDMYGTPKWIYNYYCHYYKIRPMRDVCASHFIHVCKDYWTKEDDMFTKTVTVPFFMNPMYDTIYECMEWAWNQHIDNDVGALLCVNMQGGAKWFQDFAWKPFKESVRSGIRHVDIEIHPQRIKFLDRFGNIPRMIGKDGIERENTSMYYTSFIRYYNTKEIAKHQNSNNK